MKARIGDQVVELEGSVLGDAIKDICEDTEMIYVATLGSPMPPWKLELLP